MKNDDVFQGYKTNFFAQKSFWGCSWYNKKDFDAPYAHIHAVYLELQAFKGQTGFLAVIR